MAVTKRTRYEVLRRDEHRCTYCGLTAAAEELTVDHVIPSALGGKDDPSNLVASCRPCNAGKAASSPDAPLVEAVDESAVQLAQAIQLAAQERMAEHDAMRERVDLFDDAWCSWTTSGKPLPREGNWRNSITKFLAMGLDGKFLADAADTALGNRRVKGDGAWSYFCGICWRELDAIRERATSKLDAPAAAPVPDGTATLLPQGAGLVPTFDALNPTDGFLADVLERLQFPFRARHYVHRAYWNGMQALYRLHVADDYPAGVDRDEWGHETFNEAVRDELDGAEQYAWREQQLEAAMLQQFVRAVLTTNGTPDGEAQRIAREAFRPAMAAGFRAYAAAAEQDFNTSDDELIKSAAYPAIVESLTTKPVTV